jgi:multiple sugar transport system permease protein
VISTIAAYGFSRRKTLGKENLFFFLFSLMILPPIVIAFPLFMVASRVGVNDNYLFLILVYLGILIPFGTILLKAFFDKIPTSLEDSAKIDGIPFWYYFIRIFIREARMPIAITSFFLFLTSWNEFLFAMIFATGDNTTLPVSTLGLITPIGTYWGQIAAVAVVTSFPIIILSFIFRRYLLAGFTFGIYTE